MGLIFGITPRKEVYDWEEEHRTLATGWMVKCGAIDKFELTHTFIGRNKDYESERRVQYLAGCTDSLS